MLEREECLLFLHSRCSPGNKSVVDLMPSNNTEREDVSNNVSYSLIGELRYFVASFQRIFNLTRTV